LSDVNKELRKMVYEGFQLLMKISRAAEGDKKALLESFESEWSKSMRLVKVEDSIEGEASDYQLLVEAPEGVLTLSFSPGRDIPWLVNQAEVGYENTLVFVGNLAVTFQSAFHWLRLTGQLDDLLKRMVDATVLTQLAPTTGVNIDHSDIDKGLEEWKRENGLNTKDELQFWLIRNNMDENVLQDYIYRVLLYNKTRKKITKGRVERYFNEHMKEYDRVLLKKIVFDTKNNAKNFLSECKNKPQGFLSLIEKYSHEDRLVDIETLGWHQRNQVNQKFGDILFRAKPGSMIGPFQDDRKYIIYMMLDSRKAELDKALYEKLEDEIFSKWLEEQRSKLKIIWYWNLSEKPN